MRSYRGIIVVGLVMLVTTVAFAEMTTETFKGAGQAPVWTDQTVLYDQTANGNGSLGTAQDFDAAYDAYDAEGADDFVVTWTDGWLVEQVGIVAGYWNATPAGPAASIDVVFYSDASGPGSAVAGCTYMNNGYTDDGANNFLMDFSATPCFLPQGIYWVGIQGNMHGDLGQFGFGYADPQVGAGAMWRNPGDGFASGCTSWASVATCITGGPDYAFAILGENFVGPTPTPPPPSGAAVPVPAMSNFGMVAMILLVIGVAILVMWRRS